MHLHMYYDDLDKDVKNKWLQRIVIFHFLLTPIYGGLLKDLKLKHHHICELKTLVAKNYVFYAK